MKKKDLVKSFEKCVFLTFFLFARGLFSFFFPGSTSFEKFCIIPTTESRKRTSKQIGLFFAIFDVQIYFKSNFDLYTQGKYFNIKS